MNAAAAIELLLAVLNANGPVSALIRNAQAQGRTLNAAELTAAFQQDDAARDLLADAINRASNP